MGPYKVVTTFDNGSVEIKTTDDSQTSFVVNGHRLILYHKPISRQYFVKNVLQQKHMELVEEEVIPPPPDSKTILCCFYVHMYIYIYLFNK